MDEDKWNNRISHLASFSLGVILATLMIVQNWMTQFIWILFGSSVILFVWLVWKWIEGIDYMQENHPDYKGEDLFDEENKK
jgi:membrane protein implicated in regulation of membrane protease activity